MATLPSLLCGATFFQFGYVTRDLHRAMALWQTRYGIDDFLSFDSRDFAEPGASGPFIKVALAYHGDAMIELIQPDADEPGLYAEALRSDGGVMLHHLGYLVDEARFAHIESDCAAHAISIPMIRRSGISFLYADTRADTGLFTELVLPGAQGEKLFAAVPRF